MVVKKTEEKNFAKLISRAWTDRDFLEKLRTAPEDAFKEFGIEIPQGMKVRVVENTTETVHFVLPQPPQGGEVPLGEQMDHDGGGHDCFACRFCQGCFACRGCHD
ncbi:MAG TPA: NHLP leader peptide family RiPP precursor [Verrucomicrobiae bacterium]|nr:NHLP leader peptide family RiPP precursor [Verrucomicrobiae bacterium]